MMFLNIYIAFSILTFVMLLIEMYVIAKQIKREYPDISNEYNEKNKTGIFEKVFVYLKLFVSCFVPIINIGILYTALFKSEETKKETLKKMRNAIKEGF